MSSTRRVRFWLSTLAVVAACPPAGCIGGSEATGGGPDEAGDSGAVGDVGPRGDVARDAGPSGDDVHAARDAGRGTDVATDLGTDAAVDVGAGDAGPEDDAVFVEQEAPLRVAAGASFEVRITMRNTGRLGWTADPPDPCRLGSENPMDNQTWGTGRIDMDPGAFVEPGGEWTFSATLTAPDQPGTHDMQWGMLREHVRWFGEYTENLRIEVTDACGAPCGNGRQDCGEAGIDCGGPCAPCGSQRVTAPGEEGTNPTLAFSAADRIMLVWEQEGGAVHSACFDGRGWGAAAPVHGGRHQENNPRVVADGSGRFHAVASNRLGGSRQVHYVRHDGACGGGWTEPEVVTAADEDERSSAFPDVAVDELGRPYATWSQSVVPTSDPRCDEGQACPRGYKCIESWGVCKSAAYEQHFSRRLDAGWEAPSSITSYGLDDFAHYGRLHVRSSDDVHAIWLHANGVRHIEYARFDGESWSRPEFTGITGHTADVRVDDVRVIVFGNARNATRPTAGGDWSTDRTRPGGDINFLSLRSDAAGRLHAVWSADHRIRYAVRDPGDDGWQEARLVTPDEPWYAQPATDVAPDGTAHVAWVRCSAAGCDDDGESGEIWYRRTRYGELD